MLLETLKLQSGMTGLQISRLERTASSRYKVYLIPKRDGTLRKIEHPSREIKALQRWMNSILLQSLPQHPNATAYVKGSSIKANAMRHLGTRFTLRLDFKDFFPSFKEAGIKKYLEKYSVDYNLDLSDVDIRFATRIFCRKGALTIGAPTSPSLTNRMMFEFDKALTSYAEAEGLVYTRYADDLFISSYHVDRLNGVMAAVRKCVAEYPYARLRINGAKTTYLSRKYKRVITGLTLTPTDQISVGRDNKRRIKGLIWRLGGDNISEEDSGFLAGYLAFLNDVEPAFVESLVKKYGSALVERARFGRAG